MLMINCDLGECLTPNPDTEVMPLIDMANIACGGHAGDDKSMIKTLELAIKSGVKIGAHPSYDDQANFGRISQQLSGDALFDLVYSQVSHFQQLCHDNGAVLEYVKPHGALYHDMMEKPFVLDAIIKAIGTVNQNLRLVVQADLKNFGKNANVTFLHEIYADRGYQGMRMIPRGEQGAILTDPKAIIRQYQQLLVEKSFKIDTICFHSDNAASVEALKQLKNA